MARYTLKELSGELSISYEAVRRSFWRKEKRGDLKGHWWKSGTTIYVDDEGADILRQGRRSVVVVHDETAGRIKELSQQVESLKVALAEMNADRAEAYKQLADERKETARLTALVGEYEIKLLTIKEPQQAAGQDESADDPPSNESNRRGFWRNIFKLKHEK